MAFVAITAFILLTIAGCGDLDAKESSNLNSNPESTSSKQQITNSAQSTSNSNSTTSQHQITTSTQSQDTKDIDGVQSQLDELENILKGIDDISESDLEIPNP
jgi:hypothetical protein